MNGFLVLLSHTMDDFPVGLFCDREEAIQFARELDWDAPPDFQSDSCSPCMISIVEFQNGKPVEIESVRYFGWEA